MNIRAFTSSEQAAQCFPSLSFQVDRNRCSITARYVSSIILMPEQVVNFPEAPFYCKGLIHLRGQVIPSRRYAHSVWIALFGAGI